jgi:translation elongation factor aEF-1 beta
MEFRRVLFRSFNWKPPEHIYLTVSAGTLLLGLISGLVHLKASGVIDAVPRITACQTGEVSPLYHRFKGLNYIPPLSVTSVADALISVNPPLLELMVKKLKEVNGDTVMVEEDEIIDAFKDLARSGFLVEPSSAVACAAYKKQLQEKKISVDAKTVIVLTGMGLKTLLEPYVAVQNRKREKGALHLNVQNQIRRTIEKGRDKMADVIITFKIYPQDIMDLNELKAKIEKKLPKYASIYRTSEEPVAFGLNALIAHIMMPEKQEGALEKLEQALQKVPEISQIETVMVRRT